MASHTHMYFKTDTTQTTTHVEWIQHKSLVAIVDGINLTKELITKPANIVTPDYLTEFCTKTFWTWHGIRVNVLGKKDLEKEGMWCFLAVSQWSSFEPRLITLEYAPKWTEKEAPLVLVWKWLCYDNGWMYMKPYPHANDMHEDMWWAATVLGVMSALHKLWIKKRVVWAIWVTENMVDALAYRNGDVLTARNGKTVFVEHSDAEWRLVLADVLSYVSDTYTPRMIIDFATLTWACVRALGEMYTGIIWYNQKVIDTIKKIWDNETNEKVRQLPLDKDCTQALTKTVADLSNVGSLDGMMWASTAAAFLSNFVGDTNKRIHCDIAGTSWRDKMRRSYDSIKWVWTWAMVHTILEYIM